MKKILLFVSFILLFQPSQAQFGKLLKKLDEKKNNEIVQLLMGAPPVTTTLKDAVFEAPELDQLNPGAFAPLGEAPVGLNGGFLLLPGYWELTSESYCLMAGTYGSKKGDGYSFAPLAGPKADIIQSLVSQSRLHPEISQQDIQTLIWAIIAQTKIKNIDPKLLLVATKLLSKQEMLKLAEGGLGLLPFDLKQEALALLPTPIQKILEAEYAIREKFEKGIATYEELEKLAVLTGEFPGFNDVREVVEGRWSKHPDGYFIRFFSDNYKETKMQLYVPENIMSNSTGSNTVLNPNLFSQASYTNSSAPFYYRTLKQFDPSGGMAVPARPKQRLLPSGRKPKTPNSIDKAKEAIDAINNALDFVDLLTAESISGLLGGKLGSIGPSSMFGNILEFNFDMWQKACSALEGDPPRDDFDIIAKAEKIMVDPLIAPDAPENARLLNNFLNSALELQANLKAMAVSVDRHGGALLAKNERWTNQQALAVVYFKKQVGASMLHFSKNLGLVKAQLKTIKPNLNISESALASKIAGLKLHGFSESALKAAKLIGMSEDEIQEALQRRINTTPKKPLPFYETLDNLQDTLEQLGGHLSKLPVIEESILYNTNNSATVYTN